MNLFKGLLYLIDHDAPASPVLLDARRFGAATAADELARGLGNRAESQRRFGAPATGHPAEGACLAGGCC